MMKKFLLFILCLVLCFGSIGIACSDEETEVETVAGAPLIEFEDEEPLTYSIVNPYETQKQLSSLNAWGYIGKLELNSDANYAKSGNSLKVSVTANPIIQEAPQILQALDHTSINGKNHTDFSAVTHLTLDVYSAEKETTQIGINLVYKWWYNNSTQSAAEWVDIQPGWNKIVYNVNRESIPYKSIVDENNVEQKIPFVEVISFSFKRGETDRLYYFDDLRLYKSGTPMPSIEDVREKNEIATFDQSWQIANLQTFKWLDPSYHPTFELNTDIDYTSSKKGGSLKINFPATNGRYTGTNLTDAYLDKINFSKYEDDDYVCFDFYTPSESAIDIVVVRFCGTSLDFITATHEIAIKSGQWTTLKFRIGDHRANKTPSYSIDNCSVIQIGSTTKSIPTTLYVDNIRIETVG